MMPVKQESDINHKENMLIKHGKQGSFDEEELW